jgi:hypothetical protein
VSYVASLVGKLREGLKAQKLSVAVITPYKAQVRRLKQALAPVISQDGEGDRDRGGDRDIQKSKKSAVGEDDKRDRGSDRSSGRDRGRGKSAINRGEGRGDVSREEGEEEEEEEDETPFDCEVNSIDGFQVCSLWCDMLCYAMLCCTVLCCAVLYCAVLYCAVQLCTVHIILRQRL